MSLGLAFSLLLTCAIAGVGAGLTVVLKWSQLAGTPHALSPAMWAARSYLAQFDLWALAAFVPSLMFCRWIHSRTR